MPAFPWFRRRRRPEDASERPPGEAGGDAAGPADIETDSQADARSGSPADLPVVAQPDSQATFPAGLPAITQPDSFPADLPALSQSDSQSDAQSTFPADPEADFHALVLSVAEDLGWSGSVKDGALHRHAPMADVLGLANLEQMCRQLPRVRWPDVVRSHFEQMDRA
ncbi:MAG: hypothetical protein ACXVHC_05645, partial [Frankiaceae bacterium]